MPLMCISRCLNKAEQGYAQTEKEGLAIVQAVKRRYKFQFGRHFVITTDHEALKYIYDPVKSLHKNTAAMVQRWAATLFNYNYSLKFQPGIKIPQADFLSRYAYSEQPKSMVAYLQPLHITRNQLIQETQKELSGLAFSIRNGWSTSNKKRFSSSIVIMINSQCNETL